MTFSWYARATIGRTEAPAGLVAALRTVRVRAERSMAVKVECKVVTEQETDFLAELGWVALDGRKLKGARHSAQ